MNGVGLDLRGGSHDSPCIKVAFARGGAADVASKIGQFHMQRVPVGIGEYGDRFDSQALAAADDAARDFAAVGDQQSLDDSHQRLQSGVCFAKKQRIPSCPSGVSQVSASSLAV